MSVQLQQRYRITINGVDVTDSVEGDVTFESTPERVGQLTFTLIGRDFVTNARADTSETTFKNVVKMLDEVFFEGGAGIDGDYNYEPLFKGTIKYVRPQFPDDGTLRVNIEAVDYSYRMAVNNNYYAYPSKKCERNWAQKKSIKASEIIKNIAEDMGLQVGKRNDGTEDIRLVVDKEFTYREPLTQRNETDYQLLRKLAKRLNCHFWTSFEDDQTYLHFADKSLLRNDEGEDVSFVYFLRTNNGDFQFKQLSSMEVPIWSVDLDQDFSAIGETRRVITKFDYATGEEINVFEAKIVEDGQEITKLFTFEIDESKTRKLSPEKRRELEKMSYSIAGDESSPYSIDEIAKYFKPAKFYNDRKELGVDKPYFGITINATCEGNVHIKARKNYKVKGIGRYGSDSLEGTYFLTTLRHIWGQGGFLTEMELMK